MEGTGKRTAVSNLGLSEEEKMRLRGVKVVFNRMEISSKAANVIEINIERFAEGINTPQFLTIKVVPSGLMYILMTIIRDQGHLNNSEAEEDDNDDEEDQDGHSDDYTDEGEDARSCRFFALTVWSVACPSRIASYSLQLL